MNKIAINDIGTAEDFLRAIDESMAYLNPGDIASGMVIQIDRDGALVDIGYKAEAFIPKREVSAKRVFEIQDILSIGQMVEARITSIDEEGQYILSIKEAEVEILWNTIESIFNSDSPIVAGEITKLVKGGMIVDIGVRAFLPASQFHVQRTEDLSFYIGQIVEAKIIQFEREKGNIVLSRRALMQKAFDKDKDKQFAKLELGQTYVGKVSGITDFGVFASIGLVSGLLHKSKMGKNTPESFTIGQDVNIEVLEIDLDKDRLSLALKV